MSKVELLKLYTALKARGCRLSEGREALLEALALAKQPLRAADILKTASIKKAKVDRATVYRALSYLEKEQVLEVLRLDGDERLYHLNLHHHHHLICTACKQIAAVHNCELLLGAENDITAATGFKVQRHVLEFYGLCKNCLKKNNN